MNIFKFNREAYDNRIFGLDIARFIAIITVLIAHSVVLVPFSNKIIDLIGYYFSVFGVEIFFVLSGFLIGSILIKLHNKNGLNFTVLKNFWLRRWLRTIPAYFFVLLIYFFVYEIIFKKPVGLEIVKYFLFVQNFFSQGPAFFGVSWSLSIEEWFYLTFPITLIVSSFFIKNIKVSILTSIVIYLLVGILIRSGYWYMISKNNLLADYAVNDLKFFWEGNVRKPLIFRIDSVLFGVLGSFLTFFKIKFLNKKNLLLFSFILLGISSYFIVDIYMRGTSNYFNTVLLLPMFDFSFLLVVLFLHDFNTCSKSFFKYVIQQVSSISYSVYLVHFLFIELFLFFFEGDVSGEIRLVAFASYWVLVYVSSVIIFRYIETPFLEYRDKNFRESNSFK